MAIHMNEDNYNNTLVPAQTSHKGRMNNKYWACAIIYDIKNVVYFRVNKREVFEHSHVSASVSPKYKIDQI